MSNFLSSLYISSFSPSDIELVKSVSYSTGGHSKDSSFMRSYLLIVDLSACTIGVLFSMLPFVSLSLRLFPLSFLWDSVYADFLFVWLIDLLGFCFILFCIVCLVGWDRVSLCNSPSCPGTCFVDKASLEFTEICCLCLLRAGIRGVCHHC